MGVSLNTQVQIVSLETSLQMCFLQDSQTTWIYPNPLKVPKFHKANPKCNDSNLTSWPKKRELHRTPANGGLSQAKEKPYHTSQPCFLWKYEYENKMGKRRGHSCAMNFNRLSVTPSQLPRVHKSQTQKLTLPPQVSHIERWGTEYSCLPAKIRMFYGGISSTVFPEIPFPLSILKISWSPPLYFWKIY